MNLGKIEKIIIMVLVIGGILAAGFFFLFKPAYDSIGTADNNLKTANKNLEDLNTKLARLDTIDDDIKSAKDAISGLEDKFYPDLTTYEAVEIALAQLKKCELETYGISVSTISTEELKSEFYVEDPLIYDLKTYAQNAKEKDPDAIELMEGEFVDAGKKYTITITSLADISITDENGEKVEPSKYTETMIKAYKEAFCKYASSTQAAQTVSMVALDFEVNGEYKNYLDYIDHILNFERASYFPKTTIPMSLILEADSNGIYHDQNGNEIKIEGETDGKPITVDLQDEDIVEAVPVSLVFYGVEQIEEIENLEIDGVKIVTNQ